MVGNKTEAIDWGRYFAKMISHLAHSMPPSRCSNAHLGQKTVVVDVEAITQATREPAIQQEIEQIFAGEVAGLSGMEGKRNRRERDDEDEQGKASHHDSAGS